VSCRSKLTSRTKLLAPVADTEGFEEFYTATVGRLLGQLFPVTGDLHEAEEIVQEALPGPRSTGAGCGLRRARGLLALAADGLLSGRLGGGRELPTVAPPAPLPLLPLARLDLHTDLAGASFPITQMVKDRCSSSAAAAAWARPGRPRPRTP
jgi:hypothetical protein